MAAHSNVGASSAYRWMKCPASAKLSVGIRSESSEFAKEGTAAHELGEKCLLNNIDPNALVGTSISVEGCPFEINAEMAKAIEEYTFHCRHRLNEHGTWVTFGERGDVEKKFNINWLADGMFGTCDFSITYGNTLHVIDLKYGAGKPVHAENNTQLMYYALGALGKPKGNLPEYVTMKIVQPRCEYSGVSSWTIPTEELYDWAYNELLPAVNATRVDNPKFQLGEYCTWCPVFSTCPHLAEIASGALGVDVTLPAETQKLVLPDPERLSTEQKVNVMEFMNLATPWLKAVQESVFKDALNGNVVRGYKLVQKRAGNRRWTNQDNVINMYSSVLGDEIFEPRKLVSPASMEKLLGGSKEVKAELDKLTERPDTGLELKPESDKRPAVEPQNKVLDNLAAEYGEMI